MNYLDIECGKNYFFVGILTNKGKHKIYEKPTKKLKEFLKENTIVTFNGMAYDMPMLGLFLQGKTHKELYRASVTLVEGKTPRYRIFDTQKHLSYIDHIDLKEPAPGVMVSLKMYGARLHTKQLQDLPYAYDQVLNAKEIERLKEYNRNDLIMTKELYDAIKDRIDLRSKLTKRYGIDLRSKSDAQIAEAIISHELDVTRRRDQKTPRHVSYTAPSCVQFKRKDLQDILVKLNETKFKINPNNGSPEMPDWLKTTVIDIGFTKYNIGLGGLHSREKKMVKVGNLRNADVASYYPSMIIEFGFIPATLGKPFLKLYKRIYKERMKAKKTGDKTTADGFKIVLNGSFGKLGSKYSVLYAPDLMLQVTITGQLMLLMLIEELEQNSFEVVSANTDGVEYISYDDEKAKAIIADWEKRTGMVMEHGSYNALYARDVNNYVAVYPDHVKAKGVYASPTLQKNSEYPIVFKAIRDYLKDSTPLEMTIRNCDDIRQFLSMRTVNGGAVYNGEFLGRVVRWYYSEKGDYVTYKKNGNRVPKTENAVPMMRLKKKIPKDLNFDTYIALAEKHLKETGYDTPH